MEENNAFRRQSVSFPKEIIIREAGEEKHICPFCGQEMERHSTYDHYEEDIWYTCSCEDWKKMKDIENQINSLRGQIPKPKFAARLKAVIEPYHPY